MTDAVDTSLQVLDVLGEPLPPNPSKRHVLFAFLSIKRLLRSKTNEMILPLMSDPGKIAASQVLNLMFPSAFRTRPLLLALVVLKLVRLSVKYGLNAVSAVGFSYYGSLLCAFPGGDVDRGYEYGQLALSLLDKFHAKEWIPRVYLGAYGHRGSYKLPLQDMVPHLEYARQIAMETGDIEYASLASNVICAYIHLSGDSLAVLEEKPMEYFRSDTFQLQQSSILLAEASLQLVHNLMGRNDDPLRLCGEVLKNEADVMSRARAQHDEVVVGFIHFFLLQLAYIFNEYEAAAANVSKARPIVQSPYLHPSMACPFTFLELALLAVCNNRQWHIRRRILSSARCPIKKLKAFSSHTPENCLGKMYLLQAEVAAVTGKQQLARCKYASAAGVSAEF